MNGQKTGFGRTTTTWVILVVAGAVLAVGAYYYFDSLRGKRAAPPPPPDTQWTAPPAGGVGVPVELPQTPMTNVPVAPTEPAGQGDDEDGARMRAPDAPHFGALPDRVQPRARA